MGYSSLLQGCQRGSTKLSRDCLPTPGDQLNRLTREHVRMSARKEECHHSYVKATSCWDGAWYFSWLCKECGHSFPREPDGERKYILKPTTPKPKPKLSVDKVEGNVTHLSFSKEPT